MAETAPTPTAPEGLTLAWVAVADMKGTLRADWINRSGGAYASYARVDVRLRNKAAPATTTRTVRTFQPFTGVTRHDITALATNVEWEVEIVASANGKTASSGWRSAAPLVTPKPTITSVQRASEADAWVYFTAPTSGLTAPTSAHVARSTQTSDAGSSTPLNNVVLPATRVRLPIPAGTGAYRAWLSYHGPAGWSEKVSANVPAWWARPAAPTNLGVTRLTSDRTKATLSWQHSGTGGAAAASFRIEHAAPGGTWSTVTTVSGSDRSYTVTGIPLAADRQWRVTAINPAGTSTSSAVTLSSYWQRPAAVTNLAATRLASNRATVRLSWSHPGTGGEGAAQYLLERSTDGQVWARVGNVLSPHEVTLDMRQGMRYGVTAINPAGQSSRVVVTVEAWWQPVPGATGLSSSRTSPGGQIRLGWSVPETGARNPVRSIIIRRKPVSGGDYSTVVTLPATARFWIDGSTTHTSQWEYEVVTVGDLGWATTRPSVKVGVGMVPPDAPTGITVTRDADNPDQLHVAFTPRSTGNAPTTEVRLKARDEQGRISNAGEWVHLSSLVTHRLTHNAGPNRVYSYAVEARNAAGTSSSLTWSEPWATTPRGASSLSARRVGADVQLDWTVDGATIATGWQIERSPDGGTNRYPLPPVAGGGARSAVHADAAYTVAHVYWVRPTREGAPEAEWVRATGTIPQGARPDVPLLVESGWGAAGEPPMVEWQHRSIDGTAQAAAGVSWELRNRAGTVVDSSLVSIAGDASSATIPITPTEGQTLRWQVQTCGAGSVQWSGWSGWVERLHAARPTLGLDVPAEVTSQRVHGTIIPPHAGWVSATVTLLDSDGNTVAARQLSPATGVGFAFEVADRATYTIVATLHDGRLRSVEQTVDVTVEWERPPAPHLTATPEGETVRLDVAVPAGLRIIARNHIPDLGAIPSAEGMMGRVTGTLADTPEAGHFAGQSRTMWVLGPNLPFTRDGLGGATHWSAWLYNPSQSNANITVWWDYTPNSYVIPPATERLIFGDVPPSGPVEISTDRGLWVTRSYGAILEQGASWDGETGWFDPDGMPDPGVVQGWLPDGSIYRAVEAASEAEADLPGPQAIRVELIRITDGIEHSLGDAQENVGYDLWPRFCAPERYIARAWSEMGSYQDSHVVTATIHQRDLVVNFGPGLAQRVSAGPRTLTITGGTIEKAIRSYAGRRWPAQYDGSTRTPRIATLDLTLWQHHAPLREWEDAHNAGGLVLLRDASGEVIHGQLVVGTRTPEHYLRRAVQITVTETAARP